LNSVNNPATDEQWPTPPGRPRGSTKLQPEDETLRMICVLSSQQNTMQEAAAVLGVCEKTFSVFLQAHEAADDAWELGKAAGRASLRRNQWKLSKHNATMAIWLGKQHLGQKDKPGEDDDGRDDSNPLQEVVDFVNGSNRGLPSARMIGNE